VTEEASKRLPGPGSSTPPVEETVRLNSIEFGGEVLRLPIAQVRKSSGRFILWEAARPGPARTSRRTARPSVSGGATQ
jgi:hypothetical protein